MYFSLLNTASSAGRETRVAALLHFPGRKNKTPAVRTAGVQNDRGNCKYNREKG
jgi:hypothetical protein